MAYQFPLNGGRINASIGGNSTSAGAGYSYISTGNMLLAGGNNITLSQNGSAITISGGVGGVAMSASNSVFTSGTVKFTNAGGPITVGTGAQEINFSVPGTSSLSATGAVNISSNGNTISIGAPAFTAGLSTGGNTAGTTGTVTNRIIFAGGNNITLSQSTAAGGNTITISGPNQTNQTLGYSAGVNTSLTSTGTFDARSLYINAHGLSAGFSQSSIFLSAHTTYAASNHSHGNPTLNLTNLSGTTASASNGLTLSLSAAAPGAGAAISAAGASASDGTVVFSNSNGVGFGMNGSTVTASHNGLTSQSGQALSASNGSFAFQTAAFSDANGVTFGTSAGSIMTASVNTSYAASNHSHGNPTLALTNLSGTTASASNGLTLSLSAAAPDAGGGIALANSETTYSTGTVHMKVTGGAMTIASTTGQSYNFSVPATSSLSATGAISISTDGSTIHIGAPAANQPIFQWMHNSAAMYSSSTSAMVNTSVSLVRMLIPDQISFTRVDFPVSVSGATSAAANTAAMALSAVGVLYSRNVSTLNAIVGQSSTTTYSYASNTGVYSSITGPRMLGFNLATSLTAGEYYLGIQMSSATSSVGTATTNLGWTVAPIYGSSYSVLPWQIMSAATNQTINLYQPLQGMNSVSISNTSQTHQQSQITQSGATAIRANLVIVFRGA